MRPARLAGGLLRGVAAVALGLALLLLVAAGGLTWRLEQGPLAVTDVAQWLLRREAPGTTVQRLTVALARTGDERELRLDATGLARPAAAGESGGTVAHLTAALALAPLLTGRLALREASLEGVRAELVLDGAESSGPGDGGAARYLHGLREARLSDVTVNVDAAQLRGLARLHVVGAHLTGGAAPVLDVTGAEAALDEPMSGPVQVRVASAQATGEGDTLRALSVQGAEALLDPPALGQAVRAGVETARLDRAGGALSGKASGSLAMGGVVLPLQLRARAAGEGTAVHVETAAVPAALAGVAPAMAPLGALDAPVQLSADVDLGPGLAFRRAALHAQAEAGTVSFPAKGGGTTQTRFASLTLDAAGTPDAVTVPQFRAVLPSPSGGAPTTLSLSGDLARSGGQFTAHVDAALDQASLADLGALWPPGLARNARDWIVENMTAGRVHDGQFKLTLAGDEAGNVDVKQAAGSLLGDDVTIWWLRPVPPVEHVQAKMVWQDADTMVITASGGEQGRLRATGGSMRITGLAARDQFADLSLGLAGPLADVLTLLKNKRLRLLSDHPVPFQSPTGQVTARLTMHIPLEADVDVDEIAIAAQGMAREVRLGGVVAGKGIEGGELSFHVTNDGLSIAGPARIDHMPGKLAVDMDFRTGPPDQVTLSAKASVRAGQRDLEAAGLGAVGMQSGTLGASVDYEERRNNRSGVTVRLDLTGAAFQTPLGWAKTAGSPGHAEGRAEFQQGRLVRLDGVRARAAGLDVALRTEVANGSPTLVRLERGRIGGTSATGTLGLPQRPGAPYVLRLSGPQLDVTAPLNARKPVAAGQASGHLPSFDVSMRFDRVVLGSRGVLTGASLTASGTNGRFDAGHLVIQGPSRTEARMVAVGAQRRITANISDMGQWLRATGLATELHGGRLLLDCVYDDRLATSALAGTMDLRQFTVQGAPVAGKVLQALTVYGIAEALQGPGLAFDRAVSPFRLQSSVLELDNAQAYSTSLGVTGTGTLDFENHTVAMTGTIVPAHFLNTLPGRIPLIGGLFRTRKGSGLFAANYKLQGPLLDPNLSINPLSVLTPGIFRRFFDLF